MTAPAAALAPRRHILPPQATLLERAVDETIPQWDALAGAFAVPSQGQPAPFQPWLAAEYELAQFAPYFDTTAALIAEGLKWLFERGTAASVLRALGWIGFDAARVDEDGAFLHIDLGRPATAEELTRVAHVVRASVPAHVHFYRVFNPENDVRRIYLDRGPALDAGMLDGDSGVMGPDGIKLSFGERRGAVLPTNPAGNAMGINTHHRIGVIRYDDRPTLDAWRLDSHVLSGVSGGVMELFIGISGTPQPGVETITEYAPPRRWSGPWGGPWRSRSVLIQPQPSGGTLIKREMRCIAAPWIVPTPASSRADMHSGIQDTPVHPPRQWRGAWGRPWRARFLLIQSEET